MAFAESHFGTVVKIPSNNGWNAVQVGVKELWLMEARFTNEEKVELGSFMFVTEDDQGGRWAEVYQGDREGLDWKTGRKGGQTEHMGVKREPETKKQLF